MGGDKIHVDSALGRGSTFSFRIVCCPPVSADAPASDAHDTSADLDHAGLSLPTRTVAPNGADLYGLCVVQRQQLRHLACVLVGDERGGATCARLLRAYGCAVHCFPTVEGVVQHVRERAAHHRSRDLPAAELEQALRRICDVIVADLDTPGVYEDAVLESLALFSPVRLLFTYTHTHLGQACRVGSDGSSPAPSSLYRVSQALGSALCTPVSSSSLRALSVSVAAAVQHFPHEPYALSTASPTTAATIRGFVSHSIRKELPKPCKGAVFLQAVCDLASQPFLTSAAVAGHASRSPSDTLSAIGSTDWPSSSVPLASKKRGPEPTRKAIGRLAARCPLRILLAEDNVINQKMMVMLLRKLGYEILVAVNGVDALQLLEREAVRGRPHEVECILMDASMDVMDGFECTRVIRAQQMPHRVRPFIIAQTANVTDDYRQRCAESGMDLFLPKPIELERLTASLEVAFAAHHAPASVSSSR
jgi:CheY-like chemotaxis protein